MSGNQPQLPPNILDALQIFANTAWHNPSAFWRTHHRDDGTTSRDVEYLDLQDHSVALQYLFGSALAGYNKILARDEYREALQELKTSSVYGRGVYIIGQPGVGKTSFLIYTLIKRLGEHKPVAVQLRASDPFYAFFTHTCTLYTLSDPGPLVQEDVWALSDLRVSTATPLDIFLDVSAKVIQAAPPSVKYWEPWGQHRGAEMFVMDIWSEEEIADLSSLLNLDVACMTALATKWGGIPRTLLRQYKNNESQQGWELHRAAACAVENHSTLHTLDARDLGTASLIFFFLPMPLGGRARNNGRRRYIIRVPTPTLQSALAVVLQRMQKQGRIEFFLMDMHLGTQSCARNIYLNWFHSLMTFGKPFGGCLPNNWPYYDSGLSNALGTIKAGQLPVIRDATNHADLPYYWISPGPGAFPGVDCVLVSKFGIFAFQVTTSLQPLSLSPKVTLEKLHKHFSAAADQHNLHGSWGFVFIGISEELVRNAYGHWCDKITPVTGGHVGWCTVDPVEVGIPYQTYTDDDELEDLEV